MKKIFLFLALIGAESVCVANAGAVEKKDALYISGPGGFSSPLMRQHLSEDGQSGLAYKEKKVKKNNPEEVTENKQKQTQRLKAVEKAYTFSGDTFDSDLKKSIVESGNASFQQQTMEQAAKEVKKENVQFIECQQGDKNCAEYNVDEAGRVILE